MNKISNTIDCGHGDMSYEMMLIIAATNGYDHYQLILSVN